MNANRGWRKFIARCAAPVRAVGLAVLLALTALTGDAFGQCSPEVGKATINEFNFLPSNNALGSSYVEIWLNPANPPASTAGWTLRSFRKSGSELASQPVAASGFGACAGTSYRATAITLDGDGAVQLLDASNRLIDVLYINVTPPASVTPSGGTACTLAAIATDKDIQGADANRKNISRDPDGAGNWIMSIGGGNNSEETICASNNELLGLVKTASAGTVTVGELVTFTLTVTNKTQFTTLSNVSVVDTLPAGFVRTANTTPTGTTFNAATNTWTIASMTPGAVYTLQLTARAVTLGNWTNQAAGSVVYDGYAYSSLLATAAVSVAQPLVLAKSVAPAALSVGEAAVFTVSVQNNAPAGAQLPAFTVNDLLPAGLSLGTPSASFGSYAGGVWSLPADLPPGSTATLTLPVTATQVGTIVNTATTSAFGQTPALSATASLAVAQALVLTKAVTPTSVLVGGSAIYTVTVRNNAATGSLPAFTVNDTVPAGLTPGTPAPASGTTYGGGVWSIPSGLAAGASKSLDLPVTVTALGDYTNTATAVAPFGGGDLSASALLKGVASLPTVAEFDAYDTSIADSPAPSKPRRIKTKVAGTAITLKVTGFAADGSIASTYSGTVTATLEYCSSVSRAAGAISCSAWAAAPAWAGQTVNLAAGKGSVTFPAATAVYEMLRVRIDSSTVTGSPWISSDQFAYRPDSFLVEALDTDDKTAGTTRPINLANFHRAGYDFTLRATARSTGGATVTGYPAGLLAAAQPPSFSGLAVVAPATVLGGFSAPTFAKLGEGVLSGTARYDEAGSFAVTLEDQHFADVDAADSGTAERYFSGAANLGRFTPDRFVLVPLPTVTPACPAGNFTYMDQPKLGLDFVLEAQNQAGGRTSNYDDAYAFGKGVVALAARDASGSDLTARLSDQGSPPSFAAGIFSTPQWALGRFAVNLSAIRFAKLAATTPDGPYDAQLAVRVEDADAIRVSPEDVTVGGKSYVAVGASTKFLFGRLWLTNAYGSELLPLPLQVQAQNWSASGWQKNTADSCTQLQTPTAANGGLSNTLRNLTTATLASPLVAGDARFVFSAPGAGNRGVVDVASAILLANGTPAVATWLSPSAASVRACFGTCGPRSPVIHLREVFR